MPIALRAVDMKVSTACVTVRDLLAGFHLRGDHRRGRLQPVAAVQSEYSLWWRRPEEEVLPMLELGYSLADVVQMTTSTAAQAIGLSNELGAIALGREADVSIIDVVSGRWHFTDTLAQPFSGEQSLVPVHTVRAGELIASN